MGHGKENDMSTLEKTINLLNALPENQIETIYSFVQFYRRCRYTCKDSLLSDLPEQFHRNVIPLSFENHIQKHIGLFLRKQ